MFCSRCLAASSAAASGGFSSPPAYLEQASFRNRSEYRGSVESICAELHRRCPRLPLLPQGVQILAIGRRRAVVLQIVLFVAGSSGETKRRSKTRVWRRHLSRLPFDSVGAQNDQVPEISSPRSKQSSSNRLLSLDLRPSVVGM